MRFDLSMQPMRHRKLFDLRILSWKRQKSSTNLCFGHVAETESWYDFISQIILASSRINSCFYLAHRFWLLLPRTDNLEIAAY